MIAFLERLPPGGSSSTTTTTDADDRLDDPSSSSAISSISSTPYDLTPVLHCAVDPSLYSSDFGRIHHSLPFAALRPKSALDVSRAVHLARSSSTLTLAPRGNGHCVAGQALAGPLGAVLDMSGLDSLDVHPSGSYAWVGTGALLSSVLDCCLQAGGGRPVAPRSWTDYLGLTVGGTLSNGGVSGQAFRYGPQTSNVEELEVVTGTGEVVVCSEDHEPELFFGALGGLGQFGVITCARIPLYPAPLMVRWIRLVYHDFTDYKSDIESLVAQGRHDDDDAFDYVEGFAFVNNGDDKINGWDTVPIMPHQSFDGGCVPANSGPLLYCIELALHHCGGGAEQDESVSSGTTEQVDKRVATMTSHLKYVRGLDFSVDVGYRSFLTRVNAAEAAARLAGTWDAPHPWLNLFIAASNIADFECWVFSGILRRGIGGPMLVYPLLKSKWDSRTSVALPDSEVFYLVALLRFNRPSPDGPNVNDLLDQNRDIIAVCDQNEYDYKVYIPQYKDQDQWRNHFGEESWQRLVDRKARFDPMAILAPGQGIFTRKAKETGG